MFEQFANILSNEELNECKKIINSSFWKYGHVSTKLSHNKFFVTDLINISFFSKIFFNKIKKITNKNFDIVRIYANGQVFGQEGDWHIDANIEKAYTFLYYFNEGNPSELGETYFIDENESIKSVLPIYNSGILFKSDILHKGSSPKISFNDMRITIAFKLILNNFDDNIKIF
jgi:hypothetical protein